MDQVSERAIRLSVRDPDLGRSRLTVAFRLVLALPHFFWLVGWLSLATTVAIANWIATLISGSPPAMFHRFLSSYIRYAAHVAAYLSLSANPYPGFTGRPGSYPIDIEIDPPKRQNRWVTGFRLALAIPAILLADALLGFGSSAAGGGSTSGGVVATVAFLGWFVCVFLGRMPQGFRDLAAYAIGYSSQVAGYVFLVTDRYPNSNPAVYESANVYRDDPVRLPVSDDMRRSRLTTFFRIPLAVPHIVWLVLWSVVVFFSVIASWFVTLIRGRPPAALHRFHSAYLRYQTHVYAFVQLVGNPFPGFTGRAGSYPVDLEIEGPERQRRLVTGFRFVLVLPAMMIAGALATAAFLAAFYSWFHALVRGRVPQGLRNLGAFELRYTAQMLGYLILLTDRYPYSGPSAGWQLRLEPATVPQEG